MAHHRGWLEGAALFAVHMVSWPGACMVIVTAFATLAYRLLAERERRKTLETTYRYAPARTVVVQDDGPGGPPMRIWVGEGERPQPPIISVRVARQRRLPPRRRG